MREFVRLPIKGLCDTNRSTFEGGGAGSTPAEVTCPQSEPERFRISDTDPRLE